MFKNTPVRSTAMNTLHTAQHLSVHARSGGLELVCLLHLLMNEMIPVFALEPTAVVHTWQNECLRPHNTPPKLLDLSTPVTSLLVKYKYRSAARLLYTSQLCCTLYFCPVRSQYNCIRQIQSHLKLLCPPRLKNYVTQKYSNMFTALSTGTDGYKNTLSLLAILFEHRPFTWFQFGLEPQTIGLIFLTFAISYGVTSPLVGCLSGVIRHRMPLMGSALMVTAAFCIVFSPPQLFSFIPR